MNYCDFPVARAGMEAPCGRPVDAPTRITVDGKPNTRNLCRRCKQCVTTFLGFEPELSSDDGWDANPRRSGGVEWFTTGHLAKALNRSPQTIRKWERHGVIPRAHVRPGRNQHGRRRAYTRAIVEGVIAIADEEGVLLNDRRSIAATDFAARVRELFHHMDHRGS